LSKSPSGSKVKTHFAPPPSEVRWVVQFQVSPLAEVKDYMQWNPFFNALLQNAKTEKPDFSAFLPYFTFQNMVSCPFAKIHDPKLLIILNLLLSKSLIPRQIKRSIPLQVYPTLQDFPF
jgi:hypothetical protein